MHYRVARTLIQTSASRLHASLRILTTVKPVLIVMVNCDSILTLKLIDIWLPKMDPSSAIFLSHQAFLTQKVKIVAMLGCQFNPFSHRTSLSTQTILAVSHMRAQVVSLIICGLVTTMRKARAHSHLIWETCS